MIIEQNTTLGDIVAYNLSTSKVFDKYGLDYCCGGNKTLAAVCDESGIDVNKLIIDLRDSNTAPPGLDYNSWPLDLLVDYIEKKHHRYVKEQTPVIVRNMTKLCSVHGQTHPELYKIKELFEDSANELGAHMQKEEMMLFPHIKKVVKAKESGSPMPVAPFGKLQNPVNMMMKEHDVEGERFREIAQLTDNYTTPADGCNTYRATFALLREFEQDLHLHIHLENNILFPSAIKVEG